MADLLFNVEGPVARIVLNRPDQMNAFSKEMIELDGCINGNPG